MFPCSTSKAAVSNGASSTISYTRVLMSMLKYFKKKKGVYEITSSSVMKTKTLHRSQPATERGGCR